MIRTELWTDGSGSRAGGPVGYAWTLRAVNLDTLEVVEKRGAEGMVDGTANRAELLAVLAGLLELNRRTTVVVYTDSVYVAENAAHRLTAWRSNGWQLQNVAPRRENDLREWMCPVCAAPGHLVEYCQRHAPPVLKVEPRGHGIVANRDLWQYLVSAMEMHEVSFVLVPNEGLVLNEECDARASEARRALIDGARQTADLGSPA